MPVEQVNYPHLFAEVTWPWGPTRARFTLLDEPPAGNLISNVNLVPRVGRQWVVIRLFDGAWEIPGGTLEPGENYLAGIRRELIEEAGAILKNFQCIGGWQCYSHAEAPYRPHLPHPESFRLVGTGAVELGQRPSNPKSGEKVTAVEVVSLDVAVQRFIAQGRPDLAELYRLAAEITAG